MHRVQQARLGCRLGRGDGARELGRAPHDSACSRKPWRVAAAEHLRRAFVNAHLRIVHAAAPSCSIAMLRCCAGSAAAWHNSRLQGHEHAAAAGPEATRVSAELAAANLKACSAGARAHLGHGTRAG